VFSSTEFEFLAGLELLCLRERHQDPGKGEIPVPGSVTVEEGWVCPSLQRERQTVIPTVIGS